MACACTQTRFRLERLQVRAPKRDMLPAIQDPYDPSYALVTAQYSYSSSYLRRGSAHNKGKDRVGHVQSLNGHLSIVLVLCCQEGWKVPALSARPAATQCHIPYIALLIRSSRCQIRSTDPYWIHHDKLLHSYTVHITLNTAYFLHLVYLPFWYIGYAYFQLCFTDPFTCD